jgi:hypothetical protein
MEFVELFVPADHQIKDLTKYIERWNDLNKRAKIYKTIEGWDTCTPNVLANKIKKVQSYYTNLTDAVTSYNRQFGKKNSDDIADIIYRDWLRNADFDKLEAKFDFGVIPLTWSVNKMKREDRTFDVLVYLNKNWFNYFIRWLYAHLEQMKERLEASKEKTKEKKQEIKSAFLEEEVECPCGGHYKLTNKSHHFKSKKHQAWEATAEAKPEKKKSKKQPKIKIDPEYHEQIEEVFRANPELEYTNEEYQNLAEQMRRMDEEIREEERLKEIERQREAKKAEEARLYWENVRKNQTEYQPKTIIRKRKSTTPEV